MTKRTFNLPGLALGAQILAACFCLQTAHSQEAVQIQGQNTGYLAIKAEDAYSAALLKGVSEHKQSGQDAYDGRELRTYSRILSEDYLKDGLIDIAAIDREISEVRAKSQAYASASLCQSIVEKINKGNARNSNISRLSPASCEGAARDVVAGHRSSNSLETSLAKAWSGDFQALGYRYAEGQLMAAARSAQMINRDLMAKSQKLDSNQKINSPSLQGFYQELFSGLEAFSALKNQERDGKSLSEEYHAVHGLLTVPPILEGKPEASNLQAGAGVLATGASVSPMVLQEQNVDLSQLDPQGSILWHRPANISGFNTRNYNGALLIKSLPALLNPDAPLQVVFLKTSTSGNTPKFLVTGPDGKPYKMKIPLDVTRPNKVNDLGGVISALGHRAHKVNSAPAASNLAAALGFNVEPIYFHRNVRLYLPNDGFGKSSPDYPASFEKARLQTIKSLMEANKTIESSADYLNYAAILAPQNVRADESGRKYILLPESSVEARWSPETKFGLGGFDRSTFNKQFFREHRALALFEALIADIDTKPDNICLNLRNVGGTEQLEESACDLGGAFGGLEGRDTPNSYGWDFVNRAKSVPGKKIYLNYRPHQYDGISSTITMNDAKWFARLVGQLTRQQVLDAFEGAGYVSPKKELLAEKFLKRRDELVEYTQVASPRVPATLSRVADPAKFTVAGYERCFNNGDLVNATCPGVSYRDTFAPHSTGQATSPQHDIIKGLANNLTASVGEDLQAELGRIKLLAGVRTWGKIQDKTGLFEIFPMRFYLRNGHDPEKPWLKVEVYRLGLGDRLQKFLKTVNFAGGTLNTGRPGIKADFEKVWDVMVVHPFSGDPSTQLLDTLKLNANVIKDADTAFHGITKQIVDGLQPGDIVISNGTIAAGPLFDSNPGILAFGPGATAGLSFARTHQVVVMKVSPDKVLAQWKNIRDANINLEVGMRLALFELPVLGFKKDWEKDHDAAYSFNTGDTAEMSDLISNLHVARPVFQNSKPSPVLDRDTRTHLMTFLATFMGLRNSGHSTLKMQQEDHPLNGLGEARQLYSKIVQREKKGFALHGTLLKDNNIVAVKSLKASGQNKLQLTFEFSYDKRYATLKDYKHLYAEAITLMPAKLQAYRPNQLYVNPLIGRLKFNGMIQFTSSAIGDIFSTHRSREQVCELFYDNIPLALVNEDKRPWTGKEWCDAFIPQERPLFAGDAFKLVQNHRVNPADKAADVAEAINATSSFVTDYMRAQEAMEKARSSGDYAKAADAIQNLGTRTELLRSRIQLLQSLVKDGEVIRSASLQSSIGAFVGQQDEITVSPQDQFGKVAEPEDIELTKLASDGVLYQLRSYFFDLYRNTVPRVGISDLSIHDAHVQ